MLKRFLIKFSFFFGTQTKTQKLFFGNPGQPVTSFNIRHIAKAKFLNFYFLGLLVKFFSI